MTKILIRTPIDQDAYANKHEADDKPNQRQRNHEAKPLYVRNAAGSQYGHQHAGSRIDTVYDVVNCVNPTSGVLMAVLAASGIPYVKWLRFMIPLALIWFVIGLVFICIGVLINWGPY